MMSEPVYILKLGLENVRCFGEKAELDLSDGNGNWRQWTVIVGDNGLGKTTLLQVLAGLETARDSNIEDEEKFVFKLADYIMTEKFSLEKLPKNKFFLFKIQLLIGNESNEEMIEKIIDGKHHGLAYSLINSPLQVFGYGANRFLSYSSLYDVKSENSITLFDEDAKLVNAEEWLLRLDYSASKQSSIQEYAKNQKEQVKEILIDILPDVKDIRFTEPTKENLKPVIEFQTPFGWVKIGELSLGYKTMVAWMVDLAARMFERYPDSDNPLAEPAIVLVDEIDLHLHPKWQRKIFTYLSEKFPKTQFVVTAHSPLVVQSAPKDANLVVLRKKGDHVVIDNDVESVQSWRLDQILNSDLFDFIPTRGPATEEWMQKRQELLQKQTLTEDEQKELAELNRKANALPSADNVEDRESMAFIRKAADYLKNKVGVE